VYDLKKRTWKGQIPRFMVFEDQLDSTEHAEQILWEEGKASKNKKAPNHRKIKDKAITEEVGDRPSKQIKKKAKQKVQNARMNRISLLTMDKIEFETYLRSHKEKIVILVDVPNFIRTLHKLYPNNFLDILRRAHELLLNFIGNYFPSQEDYIIHYFSKPDPDLEGANNLLEKGYCQGSSSEFFHLLEIEKSGHFSDIDNYLIVHAVALLERCSLKGFAIVSSDKDYLPVMKIAGFKDFKSCILGINTSEIYEKHAIGNIKFLGIMKYLNSMKKA